MRNSSLLRNDDFYIINLLQHTLLQKDHILIFPKHKPYNHHKLIILGKSNINWNNDKPWITSSFPFWTEGRTGQQLTNIQFTRRPLGFFPVLGKSSLKSPQIMVLVDVVLSFLISLEILAFSISRGSSCKNVAVYLVYFRLELTDSVVNGFFLFCLSFLRRKA